MKILVTGGSGFIGGHLRTRLEEDANNEIINLDLKNGFDIRSCTLPDIDIVFHLAAMVKARTEDAEDDASTNIMGTIRLAQHYRDKLIFTSSCAIHYPVTPYGISKLAGEKYVSMYGGKFARLCNVWGEGGHGVIDIFRKAKTLEVAGNGRQRRTYAHVSTVVEALLKVFRGSNNIAVFGQELTVREIADMFGKPSKTTMVSRYDLLEGRQRDLGDAEIVRCDMPIY